MFSLPVKNTSSRVIAGYHNYRNVCFSSSFNTLSSSIKLSPIESCKFMRCCWVACYSEVCFLLEFLQLMKSLTGESVCYFNFYCTALLKVSTSNLSRTIFVMIGSVRRSLYKSTANVFSDYGSRSTSIRLNPFFAKKWAYALPTLVPAPYMTAEYAFPFVLYLAKRYLFPLFTDLK